MCTYTSVSAKISHSDHYVKAYAQKRRPFRAVNQRDNCDPKRPENKLAERDARKIYSNLRNDQIKASTAFKIPPHRYRRVQLMPQKPVIARIRTDAKTF